MIFDRKIDFLNTFEFILLGRLHAFKQAIIKIILRDDLEQ